MWNVWASPLCEHWLSMFGTYICRVVVAFYCIAEKARQQKFIAKYIYNKSSYVIKVWCVYFAQSAQLHSLFFITRRGEWLRLQWEAGNLLFTQHRRVTQWLHFSLALFCKNSILTNFSHFYAGRHEMRRRRRQLKSELTESWLLKTGDENPRITEWSQRNRKT